MKRERSAMNMSDVKVESLLINYKTLEDFKQFQAYGHQELSMLEDLQNNIVENNSKSPFYGIYYGNRLVARMSLYERSKKFDHYFNPPQDYLVLFKLEVLPDYRKHGYGKKIGRASCRERVDSEVREGGGRGKEDNRHRGWM